MALERSVAARNEGKIKHKQGDGFSAAERRGRRRRRADAERLVELAEHLPAEESELIRSVYDRGLTAAEIARMAGRPSRTVQRRVQELTGRVASPLFAFVVGHRNRWPDIRRNVGDAVVVRGRSMRAASKLLGVSLHQVRQELDRIRTEARVRGQKSEVSSQWAEGRGRRSVREAEGS